MSEHCRKCGTKLVRVARPSGRFSWENGAALEHQWNVCPFWRSQWLGDNGHTWNYRNENAIDGSGHIDPGAMENPPHPPRFWVAGALL